MKKLVQFLRKHDLITLLLFMGANISSWLVDVGVYALMFEAFTINHILAKAISYTCGAVTSFLINSKYTFRAEKDLIPRALPRFIVVNIVSLLQSAASMYVMTYILPLHEWVAYFLSIIFSFSNNYVGNRLWVFRESYQKKSEG